jgi:hypothetical protein
MITIRSFGARGLILLFSGCALLAAGCSSRDAVTEPQGSQTVGSQPSSVAPPAALVTVDKAGQSLSFWPYTSLGLSDTPSDPLNLVFVGDASPADIRSALLSLDGDRSSLGLPPVPPFNARWTDASGDVQGTYTTSGGWTGSVIQLALGDYGPIRVHLRLFSTQAPFGQTGTWTLGGAHFEVLVPGTSTHVVLSWELAEQIVVGDLMRSGLLASVAPTSVINSAPSFRDIDPTVYNALPPDLMGLLASLGYPPQPVNAPVPLPSDGQATLLELSGKAPLAIGTTSFDLTLQFGQLVPRPFCNGGPLDYVYVEGPVTLNRTSIQAEDGTYSYTDNYQGRLRVTPMDVTVNPPVPMGDSFDAVVSGNQSGQILGNEFVVTAHDRRIAPEAGGIGAQRSRLRVGSSGDNSWSVIDRCLEP